MSYKNWPTKIYVNKKTLKLIEILDATDTTLRDFRLSDTNLNSLKLSLIESAVLDAEYEFVGML